MAFIFPYIGNVIIPTDFRIFQRDWNRQPVNILIVAILLAKNYYGFGLLLAACAAVLRRRFCVAMIAAYQVTQLWAICPLNSTPSSQRHPTPLETSAASCTSKTNMKTIKHMCAVGTTYSFIMFHQSISFSNRLYTERIPMGWSEIIFIPIGYNFSSFIEYPIYIPPFADGYIWFSSSIKCYWTITH